MKEVLRELCPPLLWRAASKLRGGVAASGKPAMHPDGQDLDVYWDPKIVEALETWGEGTTWNEIQLLMVSCRGKVLDIACGTGKVMSLLSSFAQIEVHGCDISDMLLAKAIERGIARERLTLADATAMSYPDRSFACGYSIGSLEHFTEEGIGKFLRECARVVDGPTFHMVPVSRSQKDEGWLKTYQSFHNNSVAWWAQRCGEAYAQVRVLDSAWQDRISVGKWLLCLSAKDGR